MADADRDSDLGDDSPVSSNGVQDVQRLGYIRYPQRTLPTMSAPSEAESSGEQSCESSDEGVGRDAPSNLQPSLQPHQPIQQHPSLAPHQQHQPQINLSLRPSVGHQQISNHQMTHQHQRNSPRPLDRELKVRDGFDSLKSSLHPHLASLASLAQGAPLSTSSSVFALARTGSTGGFPYAPPAFLAPAPPPPAQPVGSASSSSSEGSAAGWSFEEQYKQVRQLYEISDEPQRKEFLDDLFTFMQKRGSPINRLPIMAKSVLDLYELYNLVIARGGLVEVINKKLWQEIIKGLRLPSSITSAAFTLRTQYMKYLYDYECDKKNLSTRSELDAAIEGNKREGRRSSSNYDPQTTLVMPPLGRGAPTSLQQLQQHMQPLPFANGMSVVPRMPTIAPHLEYGVREYIKVLQLQQENLLRNGPESPPGTSSSSAMMSPRDTAAAIGSAELSRFAFWTMYNNNNNCPQPDLEPQRYDSFFSRPQLNYNGGEALNLSESPSSSSTSGGKREACRSPLPAAKRRNVRQQSPSPSPSAYTPQTSPRATPVPQPQPQVNGTLNNTNGAVFKITTRVDASTGDQQLVVSIEINGVTYEGVLLPSNGNGKKDQIHIVS